MAIADRIVVMNSGRIEDDGHPTRIYRQPASLFAADFMGEMTHVRGHATEGGVVTPFGVLPLRTSFKGKAMLCLRPESIGTAEAALSLGLATVRDAAFFGTHCRVHLIPEAAPDLLLVAHMPPARLPSAGERLILSADTDTVSIFPLED